MNKRIFFVLPLVLVALVVGILAGLFRMGWSVPIGKVAGEHGALMVGSFLGTLICLERIVALKRKSLYAIPFISGMSLIFFWFEMSAIAMTFLSIGSLGLVYIYIDLINRFGEYYFYIMMTGAIGWTVGNIIMIVDPFYPQAAPWWIIFILFTVFGERLELNKFLPQSNWKKYTMIFSISVFTIGILMPYHSTGKLISGVGLILIALWLFKYDIARKSVRARGMHRFTGSLLLAGYFWLIICGLLMVIEFGSIFAYDAMLHTFFLGFTFSMIFAHAPIIFPGVAGLNIRPFHNSLSIWGVLLQISIALRTVAGLMMNSGMRTVSGMLSAVVILFFFINLIILIINKQRKSG